MLDLANGLLKRLLPPLPLIELSKLRHLRTSRLLSGVRDELLISLQINDLRSAGICASSSIFSISINSMYSSSGSHESIEPELRLLKTLKPFPMRLLPFDVIVYFDGVRFDAGDVDVKLSGGHGLMKLKADDEAVLILLLLLCPLSKPESESIDTLSWRLKLFSMIAAKIDGLVGHWWRGLRAGLCDE